MAAPPHPLPPGPLHIAADAAERTLIDRRDMADVGMLKRFIHREVVYRMRLHPARFALFITPGSVAIGIAVIRNNGSLVATAGLKADAVADPEAWLVARIAEIEAAP